jgi:predicted metal-binding protein
MVDKSIIDERLSKYSRNSLLRERVETKQKKNIINIWKKINNNSLTCIYSLDTNKFLKNEIIDDSIDDKFTTR